MKKHPTFNTQHSTSNADVSERLNPFRVDDVLADTQGSSFLATLGCITQSRWDWGTVAVKAVRVFAMLAMLVVCSTNSFSQSTNAPARLTYDSFRMVSDRNIFNPNRYARGSGRTPTRTSSTPASRVESFSLVGIMAYEKGVFAFFDGTKGDYKKTLQTDGVISDYKVTQITTTDVKIVSGTNTFDLKVGMQMRREDEGEWFLSDGGDGTRKRIVSSRNRGSSRNGGNTGGGEDVASNGEPEVIIVPDDSQSASTEGEAQPANNDVAPSTEPSSTGNPVLDRLMRQAQELRQ